MTSRVVLICHGATSATRRAAFPADEPLLDFPEPAGDRADVVLCGPATRCRQTAAALGLEPTVDERIRECDYGRWAGRTLAELTSTDPDGVQAWLSDPAATPHGGESTMDLMVRVAGWLDALPAGRVVAVTHPSVVKAAIVHAVRGTPESFWRIDVAPLARTVLSGPRWTLRSLGRAEPRR
jgi:broad specificity phosphatase PhoE